MNTENDNLLTPYEHTIDVTMKLDFSLLRHQKKTLLVIGLRDDITEEENATIEGLLNLIDTIQDTAVDNYNLNKYKVFLLGEKTFFVKDKTGRGYTNNEVKIEDLMEWPNDQDWNANDLHEWADNAEEGNTWENATMYITCTNVTE